MQFNPKTNFQPSCYPPLASLKVGLFPHALFFVHSAPEIVQTSFSPFDPNNHNLMDFHIIVALSLMACLLLFYMA